MQGRLAALALGATILCSCAREPAVPDGAVVIDEDVTLLREAGVDVARRMVAVADDSTIVVFVDENLTDVKLQLAAHEDARETGAEEEVQTENDLAGAGIEVAAVHARAGSHVAITLSNPQDTRIPGRVHLRVQRFSAPAADSRFATRLDAFARWTAATNAGARAAARKQLAFAELDRAIAALEKPDGDARLAALARLIRTRLLLLFKVDWLEARAEAQRAAAAFARLAQPEALYEARARYLEALALTEISKDEAATNPSAADAAQLARGILEELSRPTSEFGPIERARALGALGQLDVNLLQNDAANTHFEQARMVFETAGYEAGAREMRCQLALVFLEQARFADAARAFDPLLPEIDKITNSELRVTAYLGAAHAQTFAGRTDQAAELLLKALPLAREYELPELQTVAVKGLGLVYQARGDMLQAGAFYDEAVQLAREQKNVSDQVFALIAAGHVAGLNGNLERAFELHTEAVRLAPNPIARLRARINLATDHYRKQDYPAAIAVLREALAIDLHDPRHHAYTDGKYGLAVSLIEYDKSTPKDLAEAARLVAEAMDTSMRVKDQLRVIYGVRVRAQLDARLGRAAAARAGFERVFALAQENRRRSASSEARSGMTYDEQVGFRSYLDLVFAEVAKRGAGVFRPASPGELAGIRRLESARYGSFGALRVGALDAQATARVDALLEEMGRKAARIAALIGRDLSAAQAAELSALQTDMAHQHAELDHLRSAAAAAAPDEAHTWRALAPGAVQISYALGAQHVYAVARSESGIVVTVLAPSRVDLEKQLTALASLDVRSASPQLEVALEQISPVLLPAGLLPAKSTALEIVAEGRIASLPFPALLSPTDPKRRLVETHEIAMITSLFDVDDEPRARHSRPYRFVGLASGSGTWRAVPGADPTPRLQAASKEIHTAAALFSAREPAARIKLLLGPEGNAAALRDIWGSGADVVHFATHALADLRQPVASLLVLPATDAGGKSTYLTAGQVQSWHGDAELVFLSACESAVGPPQDAGGMPGLQRAFLRAGARGVIATLAPIEDVLAQQFAEDFYLRYTSGQPAARALSDTQRAWLIPQPGTGADEQLRRRITALSHAYFAG